MVKVPCTGYIPAAPSPPAGSNSPRPERGPLGTNGAEKLVDAAVARRGNIDAAALRGRRTVWGTGLRAALPYSLVVYC